MCYVFYDLNMDGCIGSQRRNQACIENERNSSSRLDEELFGIVTVITILKCCLWIKTVLLNNAELMSADDISIIRNCTAKRWYKLLPESYVVETLKFNWLAEKKGFR